MRFVNAIISFFKRRPTLIFPSIVVLVVLLLSALSISGTSGGIIYKVLYGDSAQDPSLLLGKPQAIRSDEFLVNTQLTIVQSMNGFPRTNGSINDGKDMSLIVDVPYLEWSVLFKPQNWGFFILPLEAAFALKWWVLLGLLLLSIYYFSLRFLKGDVVLSALLAVSLSCSPFIWWWYQTGTIATIYYGIFILIIVMNLIDRKKFSLGWKAFDQKTSVIINSILLTYLLICFALILYPPFQLPIVLVTGFFVVGYILMELRDIHIKRMMFRLLPVLLATTIALFVVGIFLVTRADTIKAVTETVYPGKRAEGSGGYDVWRLLSVYLQPQLQRGERGPHYFVNQSESANFLIHPLFLLIPTVVLVMMLYAKNRKIDWILALLVLCNLLFLVHLFLPAFSSFNRLLFLQLTPPPRAIIGYGFLGILNLIYLLHVFKTSKFSYKKTNIFAIVYSLLTLCVLLVAGYKTATQYPLFISSPFLITLLALLFVSIFYLFAQRKYLQAAVLLSIFSISSIAFIHPLYKGVGPVGDARLLDSIRASSSKDDIWGYSGLIYFENAVQMAGRESITGTIFYPNVDFWKHYATDPAQNFIYNRYAHVLMSDQRDELKLIQADLYNISYRCNMDIMRDVDYILSTTPILEDCVELLRRVQYPNVTFYIYRNQLSD